MMNMPLNLTPPAINPNAEKVLSKRYYRKDENGQCVEDATGLFWRVASSVAAEEAKYEQSPWKPDALARAFYDMMTDWRFLPNSPTLMNAGSELGQLSACFVLPVGDSIEEIFDAVKFAAMIHKSGGGTGFSFSRLRPKNSRVGTTGGVASGPVSFLRIFNTATEQIKQGGTRRGANMGILQVDPGGRVADARRADAQHAAGVQPARQRGHIAQQVGHGGLALTRHSAIGVERTGGKGLRRGAILIQNAAKGLGAAAVPPGVILCLHTFAPLLFSYYVYTQIFS